MVENLDQIKKRRQEKAAQRQKENEELKNKVAKDYFWLYDCTKIIGNLDFCRAIARLRPNIDLTVLVHTTHAVKFNKLLKAINPDSALNIIQVSKFSMQDAMLLSEKIQKGGLIAIAGDRVPLMWGNTIPLSFLGSKADFPLGAYLLGKTFCL